MLFYPIEHDWMLTARPHRLPLDERFPGRYAVNSLPTSGPRWPGRDPCPSRKAKGSNAIPLKNCDKEEGELSGVEDQQDNDHNDQLYMWTNKDKEEFCQPESKIC